MAVGTSLSTKIDISLSSQYNNAPTGDPTLVPGDAPSDQITILKNLATFTNGGTGTTLAARHFAERVVSHASPKTYGPTVTDAFGNPSLNIGPLKCVYVVNNDGT